MGSTTDRLCIRLTSILDDLAEVIRGVPVQHYDPTMGGFVITVAPDHRFEEPTPAVRAKQMEVKRRYNALADLVRVLFLGAPDALLDQWKSADEDARRWIELERNYKIGTDRNANVIAMREECDAVRKAIMVLDAVGEDGVIVVPDTSSIMEQADPTAYRVIAAADRFTFVLLPTVLGELDAHKSGDSDRRRELAKKVIKRIGGWRDQARRAGSVLAEGVTVDKTITVRAEHVEPDVESSLTWLDPEVNDDRIVAAVLSIEAQHPAARVVLVTGDVNLQNKAEAAMIQVAETPT